MLNDLKILIKSHEFEKAHLLATNLLEKHPHHPELNLLTASIYDGQGDERAAIPLYEHAIKHGLKGTERAEAFIQLGSSYRCIGKYKEAERVLTDGLKAFPDNTALKAFLAITLYNLDEEKSAVSMLITVLTEKAQDPWIEKYQKALQFYAAHLDDVW